MALLGGGAGCESAKSTSFIRLHAKYRERGDVLTRDNHEIMRAIAATRRLGLYWLFVVCGVAMTHAAVTMMARRAANSVIPIANVYICYI